VLVENCNEATKSLADVAIFNLLQLREPLKQAQQQLYEIGKIKAKDSQIWEAQVGLQTWKTWDSLLPGVPCDSYWFERLMDWKHLIMKVFSVSLPTLPSVGTVAQTLLKKVDLERYYHGRGKTVEAIETDRAFYGGRQDSGLWKGYGILTMRDLKGAYPTIAATEPTPQGTPAQFRRTTPQDSVLMFRSEVEVPEMPFPPLPIRSNSGRNIYCYGNLKGIWWERELLQAEELGCKVNRLYGYAFGKGYDFQGLFEKLLELREDVDFSKPVKAISVAILGKLCQRSNKTKWLVDPGPLENIQGWEPDEEGVIFRRVYPSKWRPPFVRPVVPSYVFSACRAKLARALHAAPEKVIWCHTDGILFSGRAPYLGKQWPEKKGILEPGKWYCPAPGSIWHETRQTTQRPGVHDWKPIGMDQPVIPFKKIYEDGKIEPKRIKVK